MDWLKFIAEMSSAVAWPATVLVLALLLRRPILSLLPRLGILKYKDLQLDFTKEVSELKRRADELSPEAIQQHTPDRLVYLAAVSPRAAILEAWRELESAAKHAVKGRYIGVAPYTDSGFAEPNPALVDALKSTGKVAEREAGLFQNLMLFRNKVAHAPDLILDFEMARSYIDAAAAVEASLRSASS